MSSPLDCVIVGYNDIDFGAFAGDQKKMSRYSGSYHEVLTNSVLLHGQRTTYMDLINNALERAAGRNPRLNAFAAPLLGVCYLQSYLLKRGFEVESINFFTAGKDRFQKLLAGRPRSVAITTTYYIDSKPVIEIVEFIRRHSPETRIIVGGPYIYNLSCDMQKDALDYVLTAIGADFYIADSQGERTLSEVLTRLRDKQDISDVANLIYRDGGGEFRSSYREIEDNDMDENSVDWSLLDKDLITPLAYTRTARSCPFSCTFCNYPTMAGKHVMTSLEVLKREFSYLHSIGTRYLVFVDDTLNVPLPRFKAMLRMMIDNRWDFRWISFFRCSNADEEAFDLMQQSGCMAVFLGIESGDEKILEYMNKRAKVDRYRWGIGQLKQRNIATFASFICGFPGETRETLTNSLNFVEETGPTFFNVQLYYHDTRSPIACRAEEFSIKGGGYNWRHRTMDWRTAADLAIHFYRSVTSSTPLSTYNFSLWSIPYLVSQGITMEEVIEFGNVAREMLLGSLEDCPTDFTAQERRLVDLLGSSELARRLRSQGYSSAPARQ
jgi:radical SAM PhpK family P-methyltransferase